MSRRPSRKRRWLTSGISAEYGRFSGGVINVITKSGGNDFSGSYRLNMYKPSWTSVTPFERESGMEEREGDLGNNLSHEITFGGPVIRDRLWYFYSGRFTGQEETDTFADTGIGFSRTSDEKRNQIKLTGTLAPGHTLSGNYLGRALTRARPTFGFSIVPSSITAGRQPNDLFVTTYRGALTNAVFAEVQYSQKRFGFRDQGGTSTDIVNSPFITYSQDLGHYNAPYFDATDPEEPQQPADHRQRHLVPVEPVGRLAQPQGRIRALHVDQHRRQLAILDRLRIRRRLRGRRRWKPVDRCEPSNSFRFSSRSAR